MFLEFNRTGRDGKEARLGIMAVERSVPCLVGVKVVINV